MSRRVAIVGGGSIGIGWALVFARAGIEVALHDADARRRAVVETELMERLQALAAGSLLPEPPEAVVSRVTAVAELSDAVGDADHVQECIPEDLSLKRSLFTRLDEIVDRDIALASSSSMLPASAFADGLPGRERCLVAHPANPPHLLPIVELVPAPFTAPPVLERTRELMSDAGMSPVRLSVEVEGFVYNRLQGALLREAYCLVRDGVVTVDDADRIVREGLGRRWSVVGPFETVDLNTRGGIEVHAERMGPAYARMGAERGQDDPWTAELVSIVTQQRRTLLPLDRWEERVAWRDRQLIALQQARRGVAGA